MVVFSSNFFKLLCLRQIICEIHLVVSAKYSSTVIMDSAKLRLGLSQRLVSSVRPMNYKLKLIPDMVQGNFQGYVDISLNVQEKCSALCLHTKLLNIQDVKVSVVGGPTKVLQYSEIEDLEQLLIEFQEPVDIGKYLLSVKFDGSLKNKIVGLYSSNIGKGRTMVASKFQPTYARQAFPCFDEPEFKATYDITLVKPVGYRALSNMNEISSVHDNLTNTDAVTFATSVPMSTYLACFVICDFDYKETTVKSNGIGEDFILRAFAQKGETHKIDFALDIATRATEFYIKYYEVAFPLPKLDMIAIPDYVSGATEHWGLVTFRETQLLVDSRSASSRTRLSVANTVAHELAHMWFGNLVTMKWWDDVWLNEGFATYMQAKALDAIEPSWETLSQFVSNTLAGALAADGQLATHSIVQDLRTPDEITAAFDNISYNKGASVLRMMEAAAGGDAFRRGIRDYLRARQFRVATTPQLLQALAPHAAADAPDFRLTEFIDSWTLQPGFPLLSVSLDADGNVVLRQERFLLDDHTADTKRQSWLIPVWYRTQDGKENRTWFVDYLDNITLKVPEGSSWVLVNSGARAVVRVEYTPELWEGILAQLESSPEVFTAGERAMLVGDSSAAAAAGRIGYGTSLAVAGSLRGRAANTTALGGDIAVWNAAQSLFGTLLKKLEGTPAYTLLQKYIVWVVQPHYNQVSWDGDKSLSMTERLVHNVILKLAVQAGIEDAKKRVTDALKASLQPGAPSPPTDIKDIVYKYGIKFGSPDEWEALLSRLRDETDAAESARLRQALASTTDPQLLDRLVELSWDESIVRSQDQLTVLTWMSESEVGATRAYREVVDSWPRLVARHTLNSRYLGNLIPAITNRFDKQEELDQLVSWMSRYPEAGAGVAARKRAVLAVKRNMKWRQRHAADIQAWLEKRLDTTKQS